MKFKINKKSSYAELIFNNEIYGEKIAYIDLDDLERFKNNKMHLIYTKNEFRIRLGNHIYLHRAIMNCPKNKIIDHINHNTLDNRKENLRICTQEDNQKNRSLSKNNKSGYSGIRKRDNRYIVEIGKRRTYLGSFQNLDDAIKTRNEYLNRNNYILNEVQND